MLDHTAPAAGEGQMEWVWRVEGAGWETEKQFGLQASQTCSPDTARAQGGGVSRAVSEGLRGSALMSGSSLP